MKLSGYLILRFGMFLLIEATAMYAYANDVDKQTISDTFHISRDTIHLLASINSRDKLENLVDDSIETALLDSGNVYLENNFKQNAIFHFIGSNKFKNDFRNKKITKRIYGKLAKIFARKKYYPIAMQYYYETLSNNESRYYAKDTNKNDGPVIDGFNVENSNIADSSVTGGGGYFGAGFLSNSFQETYLNNTQSFFLSRKGTENNSEPIENYNIPQAFEDGKTPVAYAIMIQVKQPKTGQRKAFTRINNVGHTFITLLKYNSDSTCVSHSFGFYPQKDNFLSATPLHPTSSSVFKNDTVHDWDEAVGKFISERRFRKLIKLVAKFEAKKYDLNNNNCTDFGLYAANVAGISISSTLGSWPLGHGNNPANAGQSILEGKFINTDTGNTQGLFICADLK